MVGSQGLDMSYEASDLVGQHLRDAMGCKLPPGVQRVVRARFSGDAL